MDVVEILKECGALLEGHFLLSSGKHSDRYFQCARLLQYPDKAAAVIKLLCDKIQTDIKNGKLELDAVVGPALGGIIPAYELARQLGLPAFFTERGDDCLMALRRGFEIRAGMRILIAEDVVTTGKSSLESIKVLEALGGHVAAMSCIVDRRTPDISFRLPLYAACKLGAANWDMADCPLCKEGVPAVKPGSRPTK